MKSCIVSVSPACMVSDLNSCLAGGTVWVFSPRLCTDFCASIQINVFSKPLPLRHRNFPYQLNEVAYTPETSTFWHVRWSCPNENPGGQSQMNPSGLSMHRCEQMRPGNWLHSSISELLEFPDVWPPVSPPPGFEGEIRLPGEEMSCSFWLHKKKTVLSSTSSSLAHACTCAPMHMPAFQNISTDKASITINIHRFLISIFILFYCRPFSKLQLNN